MKRVGLVCVLGLATLLGGMPAFPADLPKGIVVLEQPERPVTEREALLVLPGFGSRKEGVGDIRDYFSGRGYDLYIPDYLDRDSIDECVAKLERFIAGRQLDRYRRLHVFSYIIGAWVLNRWVGRHPANNIATIVYDRSPLQERAPYAVVHDLPLLSRLARGPILREFSSTPYVPLPNDAINIGIIIESRATQLIRKHKTTALSLGELDWSPAGGGQDLDDWFYTLNDHDAMYHDFSVVGAEILHFLGHGRFTIQALRTRPAIDPFAEGPPAASGSDSKSGEGPSIQPGS